MAIEKADLVVIGAGSGGLSVASGAAQLGLKVVLFERGEMGGDCLNYGCVPSKALIAAGKRAHAVRTGAPFGVRAQPPEIDWPVVRAHVKGVIATIAPIDSQERFEGLGVKVIRETASFVDRQTVRSASLTVRARRIVVAAGARAAIPPIPGLAETPHLINETIFDLEALPPRLLILGAGPIGVELGQAFRRLGSEVVLIEAAQPLGRLDPDIAAVALKALAAEGVELKSGSKAVQVAGGLGAVSVTLESGEVVQGTHLLVAIGRRPNVEGLNLEAAGVAYGPRGIETDAALRTSNPRVFAVGDIAGKEQLTHAAGWHASAFVRTALFKARTRTDSLPMPAAVYCEPELAQIGLTEAEAASQFGAKAKTVRVDFHDNDRAQAEGSPEGLIKLVVGPGAKILGASIAGEGAGDLIQIVGLAMSNKLGVRALTNMIAPYPTRGEIVKRAASAYYAPVVFSPRVRRLVGLLQRLP